MMLSAPELARLVSDAFEAAGVEYAIGGALALGVWGFPRATQDVDVNVFVANDDLPRVFDALETAHCSVDRPTALQGDEALVQPTQGLARRRTARRFTSRLRSNLRGQGHRRLVRPRRWPPSKVGRVDDTALNQLSASAPSRFRRRPGESHASGNSSGAGIARSSVTGTPSMYSTKCPTTAATRGPGVTTPVRFNGSTAAMRISS